MRTTVTLTNECQLLTETPTLLKPLCEDQSWVHSIRTLWGLRLWGRWAFQGPFLLQDALLVLRRWRTRWTLQGPVQWCTTNWVGKEYDKTKNATGELGFLTSLLGVTFTDSKRYSGLRQLWFVEKETRYPCKIPNKTCRPKVWSSNCSNPGGDS